MRGQGLCSKHYARKQRLGTVEINLQTSEERFLAKVERAPNDCWVWTAERDGDGYGHFWDDGGRHIAHRWSYQYFIGPIPEGLVLDHLCRNTPCVNPKHLEPVTQAENVRRYKRLVTHCPRGHEYTASNTYTYRGKRHCRQCVVENKRAWRQRQRAKTD